MLVNELSQLGQASCDTLPVSRAHIMSFTADPPNTRSRRSRTIWPSAARAAVRAAYTWLRADSSRHTNRRSVMIWSCFRTVV